MRRFVDLHTHSLFSDGTIEPAELIRLAEGKRLAAIALTDHDTTDGLALARRAAQDFPDLQFIPGVEISAKFAGGTMHILGLGIDENAAALADCLQRLRNARDQRNPKIVARLRKLGMDLTMDDVLATAKSMRGGQDKNVLGRMHIAQALRRKKLVRSTDEAFDKYIGDHGPAYVDKEPLSPREVIAAIRAAGGVAVLAHPVQLKCRNRGQLDRVVRELTAAGLGGIEVYHSDHTPTRVRQFLKLARQYELLVAGGSDFHGSAKLGVTLGRPRVPLAAVADHPLADKLLNRP